MSYCLCREDLCIPDARITLCCPIAAPVPSDLFDSRQTAELMTFLHPEAKGMVCRSTRSDYGFTIVYAVPPEFDRFLNENYPQAAVCHCDAERIALAMLESKSENAPCVRIYTEAGRSCVIAVDGGHLQLCNRYATPDPADILYFLAEICDQLHWSQADTRVCCDTNCPAKALISERFTHCKAFIPSICE